MLRAGREAEREATLAKERRDTYVAVLRVVELDLRRTRYKKSGKLEKLEQVERYWDKARRVEMTMDAIIGVRAFGSEDAQRFADQWRAAVESDDQNALHELMSAGMAAFEMVEGRRRPALGRGSRPPAQLAARGRPGRAGR